MSSTRKYCSAFMIAVNGSGSPIIPAAVSPASRSRASTSASRVRARRVAPPSPPSWGTTTMNRRSRRSLSAGGLGLQRVEQLVAARGPVGDRQRDVERETLGVDVGDHVLDRQPGRVATRSTRSRRSQPERCVGVGRDDDRVGVVLADGVHRRRVRVRVADLADRVHALRAHEPDGEIDARLGGVEHGVVVDHVARPRPRLRHAQDEPRLLLGRVPTDRLEQRPSAERLVGDDEDRPHASPSVPGGLVDPRTPAGASGLASAGGLKMPCTAPGTPYS